MLPAAAVAAAMLLRGMLEHARIMLAHRTAARVQALLRLQLYDKVAELGPAWFAGARTGGAGGGAVSPARIGGSVAVPPSLNTRSRAGDTLRSLKELAWTCASPPPQPALTARYCTPSIE